ncbi:MAG TPA: hypothetical protein VF221_01575 [Chloroflexota bacterium]
MGTKRHTPVRVLPLSAEFAGLQTATGTPPFADNILARALSAADVEHLGWQADPRWFDLPEDSHLWLDLLAAAYALDGDRSDGLFGALHGMRCLGARLQSTRLGLRLQPGELSRRDYAALRERYLVPHAVPLRQLLTLVVPDDGSGALTA